jgi:hypothetical protein
MAFTAEQKRAHRAKTAVKEREQNYNKQWRETNRQHVSEYNRAYYQRRSRGGGEQSTTPIPVQVGLFDE